MGDDERFPSMDKADAHRGGFMDPRANPQARDAILWEPAGAKQRTEADKRAFQKRVAKRRARKGYR